MMMGMMGPRPGMVPGVPGGMPPGMMGINPQLAQHPAFAAAYQQQLLQQQLMQQQQMAMQVRAHTYADSSQAAVAALLVFLPSRFAFELRPARWQFSM
jgi:hypothetical protein